MMKIFRTEQADIPSVLGKIRRREELFDESIIRAVQEIVSDVAARGDEALFYHTERLDGYVLEESTLEVTDEEMSAALAKVKPEEEKVIRLAAGRIKEYHKRQFSALAGQDWWLTGEEGIKLGQVVRPLQRVGIYAPGGLAAYPSTVLMAAIPARIAGVAEIDLVTPLRQGRLNPLLALAVKICGVQRVFKVGGAQAIAALAYGTKGIPRVDKIVGPGNAYVAAAKKLVYGQVDIDMIAGPSEILIIADSQADPALVAADLIGQAEHDEMSSAILVTTSESLAGRVKEQLEEQLSELARRDIARLSLANHGAIVITANMGEAVELANLLAPEHLELLVADPEALLGKIRNAGCVFLGEATPEVIGDYIAGSNHILPTGGTARFSSPLGVYDFLKKISVVGFSHQALQRYGKAAASFASLEGLPGHARSITIRDGKW